MAKDKEENGTRYSQCHRTLPPSFCRICAKSEIPITSNFVQVDPLRQNTPNVEVNIVPVSQCKHENIQIRLLTITGHMMEKSNEQK
ncbi:hypothetical protein TNCT_447531 [Trichonephila clavata]|uniref:Uncharacterized protein n=1 Tax=Trichonephila clavata TaxID=2740835 RepID=A0A8X6J2K0_TRICU|nr:hypothetical protein TNCT_447531 [Trichonephila clavata]